MSAPADESTRRPRTYRDVQRCLAAAFLLILVALACVKPAPGGLEMRVTKTRLPSLCRAETSPCPTCGLTRGLAAGLALDLETARAFHPAALSLLALLLAQVFGRLLLGQLAFRGALSTRATLAAGAVDFAAHFALVQSLLNSHAVLQ